uniref:G-protein coupled receptors family 1 profile domain-containing protein n=1 Tax=Terrapene triunguis TaxID=2587831 RepID=A0A674IGK7_9SAUR
MEESYFSPQGREEAGSLIVLHYNPTGKLILGEKNLMVLVALWKNNKLHNCMYFLVGSLTLCDLLIGTTQPLRDI